MRSNSDVMKNKTPQNQLNQLISDTVIQVEQQPKQSNFLLILLSCLLFISVLIAGFFAYQTQILVKELRGIRNNESVAAKASSEPTIEPVIADPTADWKTYTNNEIGFSIKYPPEAKTSPRGADPFENAIQIDNLKPRTGGGGGPEVEGWFISISKPQLNAEKLSLTKWAEKTGILGQPDSNIDYTPPILKATTLSSKSAVTWGTPEAFTYYLVQGNPDEIIYFVINRIGVSENEGKIVDRVLSTFRFIN